MEYRFTGFRVRKKYDIWAVKNKIGHNFKAQKTLVCSEHFTTDDYDQGYLLKKKLMPDCKQAPTLKHDAIPSTNQMFSWPWPMIAGWRGLSGQLGVCWREGGWGGRHVPGSQPPFSLAPVPDQYKEDAFIISVVAYGVYIPLSCLIQLCPLPNQNFEKSVQDPADPAEPWIQDPSVLLSISMGFQSFHRINPLSYKASWRWQSGAKLRSTVDHHVSPELAFKDETPQGMEHVWGEI